MPHMCSHIYAPQTEDQNWGTTANNSTGLSTLVRNKALISQKRESWRARAWGHRSEKGGRAKVVGVGGPILPEDLDKQGRGSRVTCL